MSILCLWSFVSSIWSGIDSQSQFWSYFSSLFSSSSLPHSPSYLLLRLIMLNIWVDCDDTLIWQHTSPMLTRLILILIFVPPSSSSSSSSSFDPPQPRGSRSSSKTATRVPKTRRPSCASPSSPAWKRSREAASCPSTSPPSAMYWWTRVSVPGPPQRNSRTIAWLSLAAVDLATKQW